MTTVPEIFGSDVFNEAVMQQRLSPAVYHAWKNSIATGLPLELPVANEIAAYCYPLCFSKSTGGSHRPDERRRVIIR